MLFASLVFISAFLIESIGSYISIVGLSALFSTNPVIITLALSLDIAKVITVSFLYKQWNNIPKTMKYYMTAAAVILMVITSSGAAGYLSAEFQKAIIPTKGSEIQVKAMTDEKTRLESRKVEIDKQISQLPPENVRGRQKLQKQFAGELEHINTRIVEIDQELPKLQMEQVDVNAHAGPILYIAQAFDTTVESAVKYVILLIIFVFDPLAVALIIAGNFLLDQLRNQPKVVKPSFEEELEEVASITPEEQLTYEEIEQLLDQHPNTDVFECILPVPEKEQKSSKITELPPLPSLELDHEAAMAAYEPVTFEESSFEASAFEECDKAIEEAAQESKGLVELVVESDVPVQTESSKKKRGRKPKIESEPKPAITTEEQLDDILESELPEEIPELVEEVMTTQEEVQLSDLGKVGGHHEADVTFSADLKGDGAWKPSKKVLNIYAGTD